MQILVALGLGLLQGLTEFIPISSSGHLILAEHLFDFDYASLLFDVTLHLGTLLALVVYFRAEIKQITVSIVRRRNTKLARLLLLGTIPAVVLGIMIEPLAETSLRSVPLVAFNLAAVGLLMLLVERLDSHKKLKDMKGGQAIMIGVAQALSLFPGVSRSGITMVGGMLQRFDRQTAARFAFLLAIPVTTGAIFKQLVDGGATQIADNVGVFAVGVLAAAASGYCAIRFLLNFLAKHSLAVFAYYRLALAAIILLIILS